MILSFKLLICSWILVFNGILSKMNDEGKLLSHLFRNYSSQALPVSNISTKITLKLGIELSQIISVRERDQQVRYKLWMRISWTNEMMTWSAADWGNVTGASVSPNLVWVPDIVIFNEVAEKMYESSSRYKMRVQIYPNGTHFWNVPLIIKCACHLQVGDFPFDSHSCRIKIASWSYDVSKLILVEDEHPLRTSGYVTSSEWVLENVSREVVLVKYDCCETPFANMLFTVSFKRKPLYFIYTAICPSLILIILILFTFLLPSDCIERLSTIVTMLLAIVVFLQTISDTLPRSSDTTSALSNFYLALMIESTVSLIATCIVIFVYLEGSEKRAKPLPGWLRKYFVRIPDKNTHISHCNENPENPSYMASEHYPERDLKSHCSKQDGYLRITQEDIKDEWHHLAKLLDRSFLIILILLYAVTVGVTFRW